MHWMIFLQASPARTYKAKHFHRYFNIKPSCHIIEMKWEGGFFMMQMPRSGQNRGMKVRTRLVAGFFALVCFGMILFRLYYLQVVDYDFYAQRAAGQQLRDSIVPAARGDIVDANGQPLAVSATCWTIRAIPREMADEHVEAASRTVAEILELDYETVFEKLNDRTSNDKLLLRRVNKEKTDALRAACTENNWQGILLLEDTKRWYPEGDFAASLLGFTNVDNDGLAGLELEYNSLLSGTSGRVLSAKNAWGYDMPIDYDTYIEPVQGNTLQLTVDANVQHYLENYLSFAVTEYNVAARAIGIVMEVDTGRILAISTKPDYDPNEPRVIEDEGLRAQINKLEGEERSAALQIAQQTQWRNKAVSDLYEPGSVFKLVTCAAALDTGVIKPGSTFVCGKSYRVSGIPFHCANRKRHGAQNVSQALLNSCNQSFIQIGQRLGKTDFYNYFEAFGLCTATGIDLPAEPKKSEFYTVDRMGPVELASCSFGQSSKITPIQMLTAVSAIVNGGHLMQPYVVEKVIDANGKVVSHTVPIEKRQVISEETSAIMCSMMETVVATGTGRNAYVAGYRVGGKTGTSQKLDSADENARIASFVGIAPADDPKIAVLVALDEPHTFTTSGSVLAAPVVAKVIEDTLTYYGVERQYTFDEQTKMQATVSDQSGRARETAEAALNERGFAAKFLGGGGTVIRQYPVAGTQLPRGSTVILYTEEGIQPTYTIVPSLAGLTVEDATRCLHKAGLNIGINGVESALAVEQSSVPGQSLPLGSLVTVGFYDTALPDDEYPFIGD